MARKISAFVFVQVQHNDEHLIQTVIFIGHFCKAQRTLIVYFLLYIIEYLVWAMS